MKILTMEVRDYLKWNSCNTIGCSAYIYSKIASGYVKIHHKIHEEILKLPKAFHNHKSQNRSPFIWPFKLIFKQTTYFFHTFYQTLCILPARVPYPYTKRKNLTIKKHEIRSLGTKRTSSSASFFVQEASQ